MTMHKALHPRYVSRKEGGRGLATIRDIEKHERVFTATRNDSDNTMGNIMTITRK